jgi:hypothetical protein
VNRPPTHGRAQPAVELVQWPSKADRRAELARLGVPRLLVVQDGAEPPEVVNDEDWCWASSDERDVAVRLDHLLQMTSGAGSMASPGQTHLLSLIGRGLDS